MSIFLSTYAQNNKFPYELNIKKELILTGVGLGAYSLHKLKESSKEKISISKINNLDKKDINSFDRRTVNNWNPNKNNLRESFEPLICLASISGAALAGIQYKDNSSKLNKLITLGSMYAEGFLISYGVKQFSKTYIDKYRPYMYNRKVPMEEKLKVEGNESFFSGNASIMFYNTAFISKVYSDLYPNSKFKYVIMGIGFGWSTYSAWLSVKSGKHFMSDVITGALFGGITGFIIPHIHLKHNNKKQYKLSIIPKLFHGNTAGLSIALKL